MRTAVAVSLALSGIALLALSATSASNARTLLAQAHHDPSQSLGSSTQQKVYDALAYKSSSDSSSSVSEPEWLEISAKESSDFLVEKHSDHPHCNILKQTEKIIEAFNEARYDEYVEHFSHDALRFVNGNLDPATGGRQYTSEQWFGLRAQQNMRLTAHTVTRSGDWAVAVSASLAVGGNVEPARAMGVGMVLEFRRSDRCKVQVERVYHGHDSVAYGRLIEPWCEVFEPLRLTDACSSTEIDDGEVLVNLREKLEECWNAVDRGDAGAIASCFLPSHELVVNGEVLDGQVDMSAASYWADMFANVAFDGTRFDFVHVDGTRVNAMVTTTITDKIDGEYVLPSVSFFQAFHFNNGGLIEKYEYVTPAEMTNFFARVNGDGPLTSRWTLEQAAKQAVTASLLFGAPTVVTNVGDGNDYAHWSAQTLRQRPNVYMHEVRLMDEATQVVIAGPSGAVPLPLVMWCSARIAVAASQLDEVRSVIDSILYDDLAQLAWSKATSATHCISDMYIVAQIVEGDLTAADAKSTYYTSLQRASDLDGDYLADALSYLRSRL